MNLFMGFGLGMVFAFVLMVIVGGFFMWIAAKIARVEKSTFGRAIVAAIASSFVSILAAFVFHFFPVLGNFLGYIIGLLLSILIIKGVFETSFGKALLVWVFDIIAKIIAVLAASVIVAGSFAVFSCI